MGKAVLILLFVILMASVAEAVVRYDWFINPFSGKQDRSISLNQNESTFTAQNLVAKEVNASEGMTLNGVRITDWPASSPTAGDKWLDGGSFIYPNDTFSNNVVVYGYIYADDWSNISISYSQVNDWNPDDYYLDSDVPNCGPQQKVTADGDTFTCTADLVNTTTQMRTAVLPVIGGGKGLQTTVAAEQLNFSWDCSIADVSDFECGDGEELSLDANIYSHIGGFAKSNETNYLNNGGFSSINLTSLNVVLSTNASFVTTNEKTYAGHGGATSANLTIWNVVINTNTSWVTASEKTYVGHGGFSKSNETSYANNGGFSLVNLSTQKLGNTTAEIRSQFSGSSNISYDSTNGKFWINMSIVGSSSGSGGGGIWIDGGNYAYLNTSAVEFINTTINLTQLQKCAKGEHLEMVNGTVTTFNSVDGNDFRMSYNVMANTHSFDSEHCVFGVTDYIGLDGSFDLIRAIQNFNIISLQNDTIYRAILRVSNNNMVDENHLLQMKIYAFNDSTSPCSNSDYTANAEYCWNITTTKVGYVNSWNDISLYDQNRFPVNTGDTRTPIKEIDVTYGVKTALLNGNSVFGVVYKSQWDLGINFTNNVPLLGTTPGFEAWNARQATFELISQPTGPNMDESVLTQLIVWHNSTNPNFRYQCVKSDDGYNWGVRNAGPDLSKENLEVYLNNSKMTVNCSNIWFATGIGSSSICDGVDGTGSAGSYSELGGWTTANSTADNVIRNTNTSWLTANEKTYSGHGGATSANLTIWNVIINTNTSWVTANEKTYSGHGGYTSTNETTYVNHGGFSSVNWSTMYTANGFQNINLTLFNVIKNTNTSWLTANQYTYNQLGGYNRANETTYNGAGGWNQANFSTAYNANGWQLANFSSAYSANGWSLTNDSAQGYVKNITDTNFTKTCWGPVCTFYNYTMGALVTQVT